MPKKQTWPHTPTGVVTSWGASSQTVRLALPIPLETVGTITVGAVGAGWLELTDDPDAPRIEIPTELQTRGRLAISARGGIRRFAADDGDKVFITVCGAPGHRHIRVVALDCMEHVLRKEATRPTGVFKADGWTQWRRAAHAETADRW